MNRNATIGVVLVGVLLAAISVGIATYMSKGTIDQSAETLRAEMAASASDVGSQIATIEENTVAKENGEAVSLAAVDTLWSKGRLTVTDAAGTGLPLFEVDPEASRIVLGANAIEIGDLTAGAMTSTGVVTGEGFQTTSGSWAVDSAGDMKSGDLTVSGDTAVAGILKVNGGELRVGDGFVYDADADTLAVIGAVVASNFRSTNEAGTEFESTVIFDQEAKAKSGAWNIAQDGTAKFGNLTVGAINAASLTATGAVKGATLASTGDATVGGNLAAANVTATGAVKGATVESTGDATVGGNLAAANVTATGAVKGATLESTGNTTVGGDLAAVNVTATGDATAANIIATGTLKAASDKFTVDALGNTAIGGTLTVGGANAIPANATAFWVDAAGAANVTDLYIDGVKIDPVGTTKNTLTSLSWIQAGTYITADSYITALGDVTGANLISTGTLDVGSGNFTVDAAGNTAVAGTLTVASLTATGAVEGATLASTGDASVGGDLSVTGTISAANLPDGMVAGYALGDGTAIAIPGMPGNAIAVVTAVAPSATVPWTNTIVPGTLFINGDPTVVYNYIVVW